MIVPYFILEDLKRKSNMEEESLKGQISLRSTKLNFIFVGFFSLYYASVNWIIKWDIFSLLIYFIPLLLTTKYLLALVFWMTPIFSKYWLNLGDKGTWVDFLIFLMKEWFIFIWMLYAFEKPDQKMLVYYFLLLS